MTKVALWKQLLTSLPTQAMGVKEKKRFEDMAAKDKERYNKEMANYDGPPAGGKRKKKQKDPNAPKRAL